MTHYIHLTTDVGFALGKGIAKAAVKEIFESFDMKLFCLKKGKNVFIPLQEAERFSEYIIKHNVKAVKIQADKKGVVFSLQDKLRRPMP